MINTKTLLMAAHLVWASIAQAADYEFVNVNVVPMTSDVVIPGQTVRVSNGRIERIGPAAEVDDGSGATRIDASGAFLMPGLAEMHAHVPGRRSGDQAVQDVLHLYLANGITLIRGMLGQAWHLELRSLLAGGEWTGPELITSGPSFNGNTVTDPEQAARRVREQAAAGYDFLKLHPGLERDEYQAIVSVADELGIPIAGHVGVKVGLSLTLSSAQASIDHLDGYAQELVAPQHELYGSSPGFFGVALTPGMSEEQMAPLAAATRRAGVWNVPTQSLMENVLGTRSVDELDARPEMRYISPATRARWRESVEASRKQVENLDTGKYLHIRRALIRELQQAGAGLLLGSDAPQVMNVPGFSIHEELDYMVAAGLTPFDALSSGTRNVAAFFGRRDEGQVSVGFVANLVLLAGNPLQDINATRQVLGVMRAGRWYDAAWIQSTLSAISARNT